MTDKKRKTLGTQIIEKAEENITGDVGVQELIDTMHQDYEKNLIECIENGIKIYPHTDFYVTALHKTERLFPDVSRLFWVPRISCPTPTFDQTVYRFHHESEMLEFLWTIPGKEICEEYRLDPLNVPPEEHELRQFVLDFYDGTLDRRMKILNNEKLMEPSIVIRKEDTH